MCYTKVGWPSAVSQYRVFTCPSASANVVRKSEHRLKFPLMLFFFFFFLKSLQ